MSFWELREAIEKSIPWWTPFAVAAGVLLVSLAWTAYRKIKDDYAKVSGKDK